MERRLERLSELAARQCVEKVIRDSQEDHIALIFAYRKKWQSEDAENPSLQMIQMFMDDYDRMTELYGKRANLVLYAMVGLLWLPSLIKAAFVRERG
jgi:hypothetical protein